MDVYGVTYDDHGPAGDQQNILDVGLFTELGNAMQHCIDNPKSSGGVYEWEGDLFNGDLRFGNYHVRIVPVAETASREDINDGITNEAVSVLRTLNEADISALRRAGVTIPDGLMAALKAKTAQ